MAFMESVEPQQLVARGIAICGTLTTGTTSASSRYGGAALRLRKGMVLIAVVLGASAALAGCGSLRGHGYAGPLVGPHARRVMSEPIPNGYMALVAEDRVHKGETYMSVDLAEERPGRRGLEQGRPGMAVVSIAGTIAVTQSETNPFIIATEMGCEHSRSRTIAYGVLRNPADTVEAHDAAGIVNVARAPIPGGFHARGVFVYAIAYSEGFTVVARTPAGRIIGREDAGAEDCSHARTGSRHRR